MTWDISADDLATLFRSDKKSEELDSKYHGVEGILDQLRVDPKQGLPEPGDSPVLVERMQTFGENVLPKPPVRTLMELMIEAYSDKTLIMLSIAAFVSLVLGIREDPKSGWIEGTAIIMAVFIVVLVSSLNDYAKEKQFRKLNEKKEDKVIKTVRNGHVIELSVFKLLVGDVVCLETGDIVPSDGLFLEGQNLVCDESSVTGETDPLRKNAEKPFIMSGTRVTEGFGHMLVCAVGTKSIFGETLKLSLLRGSENEDTPLQQKLEVLADNIAKMGLGAAVVILIALITKLFVVNYLRGIPFSMSMLSEIVKYLITAITIVVVAVPEGLPLAVTISLAFSMVKMMEENNLVRKLEACETMGGANFICSDKTGTLTENKMTVVRGYFSEKTFADRDEVFNARDLAIKDKIVTVCTLNSTAQEIKDPESDRMIFMGNKTECALLNFCKGIGADYAEEREIHKPICVYPFSSKVKRMTTLIDEDGKTRVLTKGASETILGLSTNYFDESGNISDMSEDAKKKFEGKIEEFAGQGLRTLCIATKITDLKYVPEKDQEEFEKDLCLIGVFGIEDPLRKGVKEAVAKCKHAGVSIKMVTGDNITTAKKIATDSNIYTGAPDEIAMTGPEFREKTDDELTDIVTNLRVLARSSPKDKYILVQKLKKMGNIVAVTGDGTNDAPALKEAHVGFSMGIAGTEVAKEASDIILMDDNFASTVIAVLWGRNVFDSIRKFLQFQVTVNIVAVATAFVGALTNEGGESPLKPVQLLWVNLIMDTMAALALATEPPPLSLLDKEPYGPKEKLISPWMWRSIVGQSIYQLILNFGILYVGHLFFGVEKDSVEHLTLIFNVFVLAQVFNEFNSRKLNGELNVFAGIFSSGLFLTIIVFTVVMQYVMVQYGGTFASTTPLSYNQWLICIGLAALSLPVSFIIKLYFKPYSTEIPEEDKIYELPKHVELEEVKKLKAGSKWGVVQKKKTTLVAIRRMTPKTTVSRVRRRHR